MGKVHKFGDERCFIDLWNTSNRYIYVEMQQDIVGSSYFPPRPFYANWCMRYLFLIVLNISGDNISR